MAASNRTTQADMLRRVYRPSMRQQFNTKNILLQYLQRNNQTLAEGADMSFAVHSGQSGGWGWSSSGNLPPAGRQRVKRASFNFSKMYGRIEIAGDHIEGSHTSEAAERRPYDFETKNLIKQMKAGLSFELFLDGTGLLSTPAGATSATVLTATAAEARGLETGMVVDVLLKSDGSTGAAGVSKAEIDVDTTTSPVTITLTSGSLINYATVNGSPTSYGIYRHGSYNQSIFGLNAAIGTTDPASGAYLGISRTTNPWWKGQYLGNSGTPRAISLKLMQQMADLIDTRSDGETNLIICHHNVWNNLADILVGLKRYEGNLMKLNGWCSALEWQGVPVVRDKHCPSGRMYFLDTSTFQLWQNNEGDWMDKDGSILSRVPDKHAYEAAWFRFLQLVCDAPNANGILDDITAT